MKFLFLILVISFGQVGFAANGYFDTDPTDPAGWYKPSVDTSSYEPSSKNTRSYEPQSNPSGGLLDTTDSSNPSGGQVNTSEKSNPSGVQVNTSQNSNPSGGQVSALGEVSKPNLTVIGVTNWFIQILNYVAILLFTAALVVFLYGIFMLMFVEQGNEESRSKGKKFMMWGIISLFVMTSTWGLVNVLKSSIFGTTGGLILPQLK